MKVETYCLHSPDPHTPIEQTTDPIQARRQLKSIKDAPLDENIARRVDEVWQLVKDEAPVDNYHM